MIEVTGAAPVLRSEESSSLTSVPADAYAELPLNSGGGRSTKSFEVLTPGVQGTNEVNGSVFAGEENQIDGITTAVSELAGDDRNIRIPPEAVQELSIVTTAYPAEYGGGAGVSRYEIKSGTNQFHGNAYDFFKNTVLDAKGYYNTPFFGQTGKTPVDQQNEFGFSVGGPVSIPKVYDGRNKTFFFFNFDGWRTVAGNSFVRISLPTDLMRAGDFSQVFTQTGANIYDPATTVCSGGTCTRTQFSDPSRATPSNPLGLNIIPTNRLSPAALNILALMPHATDQSLILDNTDTHFNSSANKFNDYTVKGDQYFGPNHHLSLSHIYSNNPQSVATVMPFPVQSGTDNVLFLWQNSRVSWDWTISPALLNTLRLGYNRQVQKFSEPRDPGWQTALNIPGYATADNFFPRVGLANYGFQGGLNEGCCKGTSGPISNTLVLSEALAWEKGRHSAKFGVEYRYYKHGLTRDTPAGINFSRNETADPSNLGSTGSEIASFLLGQAHSSDIPNLHGFAPTYNVTWTDLYAQDDIKVTPRFTANLGLRFSMDTPTYESHNQYSVVDLRAQNSSAGGILGAYVFAGLNGQGKTLAFAKKDATGIQPRIGFAWKATNRLVVRSAFGRSYMPTGAYGNGGQDNSYFSDGFTTDSSVASQDGFTPALQLDGGFPAGSLLQPTLNDSLFVGTPNTFRFWSPRTNKLARMDSWNLTTQWQLASNSSLEIAYVGTKGTYLYRRSNINQLDPKYFVLGSKLNLLVTDPAAAGLTPFPNNEPWPGFAATMGSFATVGQALRPFPQYAGPGRDDSSSGDGNSTYNALQAKFERRFSNGLYWLTSYTWDKWLEDTRMFSDFEYPVINQYNHRLDTTVSDQWQPHTLTTAFTYELPIGPGKKFANTGGVMGRITGGWRASGILTYRSGNDIILFAPTGALPSQYGGTLYAVQVPGVSTRASNWTGNPTSGKWLNSNAFSIAGALAGQLVSGSQVLPNTREPGTYNEDLSLFKETTITERLHLQLGLEAFNALNRVRFGCTNTNLQDPNFGTLNCQSNNRRQAQIVGKLTF